VIVVDRFDRVVDLNAVASAITGRGAAEWIGYRVEEILPACEALADALRAAEGTPLECDGPEERRLEVSVSPIRAGDGLRGRVIVLRDVTSRRRAEAALRESEALLRGIVEHSPNGILRLRPKRGPDGEVRDFVCVFANPAAAAYIGRPQSELVGRPFKGAVHPHTAVLFQAFREVVRTGAPCDLERTLGRDGRDAWFRFIAVRVGGDLAVTFVDVTERKLHEREMHAAACQDPLTGLLNRRGLEADGPAVLRRADGGAPACALLYLDLDRFKEVNDAFGHEAGDVLLCEFAARVQSATRGPDLLARLGGDELVVLLPDAGEDGARWVAERILEAAREPYRIGEHAIECPVSIGIALCPEHGEELKALVQAADRAMYQAKARGGALVCFPGGPD
jgi:diguanylate cyclase (GGDEF)-like protein/PAS domain S-box-containing protein